MLKSGSLVRFGRKCELEAALEGKIWEGKADGGAQRGVILRKKGAYVRVFSEKKPFEGAGNVRANLEDVYMTEEKR